MKSKISFAPPKSAKKEIERNIFLLSPAKRMSLNRM